MSCLGKREIRRTEDPVCKRVYERYYVVAKWLTGLNMHDQYHDEPPEEEAGRYVWRNIRFLQKSIVDQALCQH